MRQSNTFRRKIEGGEAVLGARSTTFSQTLIELYGQLGLDFVWLDFEHSGPSPYDSTVFENLSRTAEVAGIELFVRLPSGQPPLIRKVLDARVRNILIPRVDSAAEVREAVKATRFVYDGEPGERGMGGLSSTTWGDADDYAATEDDEVAIGVMIEKQTALDSLDEILSVTGLDFVFIGQSDLSVQMGHPSDRGHPEVVEAVERIREAATDHDIPVGTIATDPAIAADAIDDGYQIVRIGDEKESVQTALNRRMREIADRTN